MTRTLLDTKLIAPKLRRGLVARPGLTVRLERGTDVKLTLVSAPAGFGKTTLVAEWRATAAASGSRTAWLSLDPGDSDPPAFWAHVIAAFQAVEPAVGVTAASLLASSETATETAIAALLNDLAALSDDLVLVLDDYHAVDTPPVAEGMTYLLDHLPSSVHLVITTRADPALPLPRLRARGELLEIRATDLRFTEGEAAAYLNGPMGLTLSSDDVAALEGRTEGWIAALQLAALSIAGRADPQAFIAEFAGDDRYIVDYLVEEVLERQPDAIRDFLLQTSILDRLTGSLCDAVTGHTDGSATLEALDRANLFVIALDDRRRWYRYHQLFADVLRARWLTESPGRIAELHGRASRWFEGQGEAAEAIRHALAADDVERAADLIELAAHDLRQHRQELTLRRWLDALPESIFDARPVLAIAHVGALLATGDTTHVEERLAAAERWVGAGDSDAARTTAEAAGMVVRHPVALGHLASAIALYRAALARLWGDNAAAIANARAAFDAAGPDQPLERGGAAGMLALAYWTAGELDAADGAWSEAIALLGSEGHVADVLGCSIALADIRIAQGRLHDARRIYEHGLRIGAPSGGEAVRGAADMHVGLADVHRERGDLAAAAQHLEMSRTLGEPLGLPQNAHRQRVASARLRQAAGDLDGAIELLDEAAERYDGDFFPDVRPIGAITARVRLSQGRLDEARAWAGATGLGPDDPLTYLHEFEHATLARLLVAEGVQHRADASVTAAIGLAERLVAAAEAGGRTGSAIDALVVLALARQARGDGEPAVSVAAQAVGLAAPEGHRRIFLDEGPPMLAILRSIPKDAPGAGYAREMLSAAGPARPSRPSIAPQPGLLEPLSERELDVLRLLQGDLDGPDIASQLFVSLNTVRTHTKNIYAKLGVNSRREAVRRATELGILAG